jgi:hypothetical protein
MLPIDGKIFPLPRGWGLRRAVLGRDRKIGKGENVGAPSCQKGQIRDKLEVTFQPNGEGLSFPLSPLAGEASRVRQKCYGWKKAVGKKRKKKEVKKPSVEVGGFLGWTGGAR